MSESTNPITGPGISWAISQINRRFERAVAKSTPVPTTETETEASPESNPPKQNTL